MKNDVYSEWPQGCKCEFKWKQYVYVRILHKHMHLFVIYNAYVYDIKTGA